MNGGASVHEEAVRGKLVRVFGSTKGPLLFDELLRELSLPGITSADDVMAVGDRLRMRGGLLSVVGTSLIIHADLHGASRR